MGSQRCSRWLEGSEGTATAVLPNWLAGRGRGAGEVGAAPDIEVEVIRRNRVAELERRLRGPILEKDGRGLAAASSACRALEAGRTGGSGVSTSYAESVCREELELRHTIGAATRIGGLGTIEEDFLTR